MGASRRGAAGWARRPALGLLLALALVLVAAAARPASANEARQGATALRVVAAHEAARRELKKRGGVKLSKAQRDRSNPYSPRFRVKDAKKCIKPLEDRFDEDRYCESTFKPDPTCGCKEVCHIWGDPHASPFFSGCSEVAMGEPGLYTAYKIPEDPVNWPTRTPLEVKVSVEQYRKSKWKFVRKLYVNNTEMFSVKNCQVSMAASFKAKYPVFSNDTDQVLVTVKASCNARHETHLNVTVVVDTGTKELIAPNGLQQFLSDATENLNPDFTDLGPEGYPSSTLIFPDDTGICVDPMQGKGYGKKPFWEKGDNCIRPSGFHDGADCSCGMQCAAYGDPHMFDFSRKQELGNDFLADVQEPRHRVMYALEPYYSAVVKVDDCAFIKKFYAIYRKNNPDSADVSDLNNYDVVEYDVDELCGDDEVTKANRKIIFAPDEVTRTRIAMQSATTAAARSIVQANIEYYDQRVSGFNTGTFVRVVDPDTKVTTIEVVPRSQQDRINEVFASNDTISEVIVSGGVQAVLKCHITEDLGPKQPPRKYFNMCLERNGIEVLNAPGEQRRRRLDTIRISGINSVMNVEDALVSRGHCATGAMDKKKDDLYEHRDFRSSPNTNIPNPEVDKAELCLTEGDCS